MVKVRPDDIRLSFNEAPEIYDKVRPSYPTDLFDALFQMLPSQPEIVEVGPGTGQATKDLLARGASVLAIEIGPATAARLRSNLPSDRLRVAVGDFEVMEIAAGEADAMFSATAYHWISREAQTDRPAAILRPGGLVAIVDFRCILDNAQRLHSLAHRLPVHGSGQQIKRVGTPALWSAERLECRARAQLALMHIRTGRERATTATNDRHMRLGVDIETTQRLGQCTHQLIAEGGDCVCRRASCGIQIFNLGLHIAVQE